MPKPNVRENICHAAIRVAARDGLLAMTLDNVAREAGISKGGLVHHFATKDDLIRGVLEFFGRECEAMLLRRIADDPNPHFRWARSAVACTFPGPEEGTADDPFPPEVLERFMLAVFAAGVNNPGVFAPLREMGVRLRDRLLADGDSGMDQLLIWLAMDGLALWQFLGMIGRDEPLFAEIGRALRERVGAAPRRAPAPTPDGAPKKRGKP